MDLQTEHLIAFLKVQFDEDVLQKIDWEAVKQRFIPTKAICCVCESDEELSYAETSKLWINYNEKWYCPNCREDMDNQGWHACAFCLENYPEDLMQHLSHTTEGEGFFCPDCAPCVMLKPGDYVTDANSRKERYYGEVQDTTCENESMVWVCWFKWGYVKPEDRTPLNVIYAWESIENLRKGKR